MATILICGSVFDGESDVLLPRTEILIENHTITEMAASVSKSSLAEVIDLTQHTILPQLIVPGLVPRSDAWRELYLLTQSGVAAVRVLQAATSAAATLMGRTDIGIITPGKTATLIAVRGNPFNDISIVGQPDFIMTEGRTLRWPSRRAMASTGDPYQPREHHHLAVSTQDVAQTSDRMASM